MTQNRTIRGSKLRATTKRVCTWALLCGLAGATVWRIANRVFSQRQPSKPLSVENRTDSATESPQSLTALLRLSAEKIKRCDIARMNLLAAHGLPGAEQIDASACLSTLDQWATHAKAETERHLYRFRQRPEEFENSEGYFRMLMMAVVLAEDFQVRYNPARKSIPEEAVADDGFFSDSRDVFLHGIVGRRMGTCSSMPVLYVALGRRLGYPVKLVTTKGHLFVRWEDARERFNVEATGRGMNRYDDEHYRQWPFPIADQEIAAHGYLKSLTPTEELAVFMSLRGQCLAEAGRMAEAKASYAEAARGAPNVMGYRRLMNAAVEPHMPAGQMAVQPSLGPSPAVPAQPNGPAGRQLDPNPFLNVR